MRFAADGGRIQCAQRSDGDQCRNPESGDDAAHALGAGDPAAARALTRRLYDPIYKFWLRAEWEGLEHVPTTGAAIEGYWTGDFGHLLLTTKRYIVTEADLQKLREANTNPTWAGTNIVSSPEFQKQ